MNVYLAVTIDEYELPIAIGDTLRELGNQVGMSRNAVASSISKNKNGKINGFKCIKVEIEDYVDELDMKGTNYEHKKI